MGYRKGIGQDTGLLGRQDKHRICPITLTHSAQEIPSNIALGPLPFHLALSSGTPSGLALNLPVYLLSCLHIDTVSSESRASVL